MNDAGSNSGRYVLRLVGDGHVIFLATAADVRAVDQLLPHWKRQVLIVDSQGVREIRRLERDGDRPRPSGRYEQHHRRGESKTELTN